MKTFFQNLVILSLLLSAAWARADVQLADSNADGTIDMADLVVFSQCWLQSSSLSACQYINAYEDSIINLYDFQHLSGAWDQTDPFLYLVGRWKFDENRGSVASDASGQGHPGTLVNFPASPWSAGWLNNALTFDGTNDYVLLSDQPNGMGQHFTRDFTISAWLCPTSLNGYQVVIGIESTSRFETYGFEGFTLELFDGLPSVYITYPDLIGDPYPDMTRDIVPGQTPLELNQWHHLCIVRKGPQVRFYFDGLLDAVRQVHDTDIYFGSEWPGYDSIGATYDSYYDVTSPFKGKIDDVYLYNTAVSEKVVEYLARQYLAWNPRPADLDNNAFTGTTVQWSAGIMGSGGHDVYFGTDAAAVTNADTATAGIYKGRQTTTAFDPGMLNPLTPYYWRVDEFDGSQIHKGMTWTFTTSTGNYTLSASSSQTGFSPTGAYDGERFGAQIEQCWKGQAGQNSWWWQANFTEPTQIGSILQIVGDRQADFGSILDNAPQSYQWQWSNDGINWNDLAETSVSNERRLYRICRLSAPVTVRYLRMAISACTGAYPAVREIEFYPQIDSAIAFPEWVVAVLITELDLRPSYEQPFLNLLDACPGMENIKSQAIWLADFDESYLDCEPYPLCAFLSGSILEWCQRTRENFAGLQEVLDNENMPIWGACGGAQALGILTDTGYLSPWDCPRCRNSQNPFCPIYGHIGYLDPLNPGPCGDYEHAIMEIGPTYVTKLINDPVLNGLPGQFLVNESHMGQLEYLPYDWQQVCGAGTGALTEMQCYKKIGKPIYGAQFHIENYNAQTWNNAILIMTNFLNVARDWGGYQPD